jgi:hypothetical protein
MAEDEEQTLVTFRAHSAVFETLVTQHRGRVFNRAGDAILAEFDSAVEAVRCATDIQAALQTRNAALPENRRVLFRIGINLGDVLRQGDDLLGDGVNVAARLQSAAAPGGICLSGSVYDQIVNKLSLSFKPLGEMSFKNIPHPIRTFSVMGTESQGALPTPARGRSGARPMVFAAIAVLIVAGGGYWAWSQHRTGNADSTAAAAVVQTATAPEADGLYAGPICLGQSAEEGPRCFRAEATLANGHIDGQWKGREPIAKVFLSGVISSSGDAEIDMHGVKDDGSRAFQANLQGKLASGKLDANGTFISGRTVQINWTRQN